MRRFSDKTGHDWVALETLPPEGIPERRRTQTAVVSVAFSCDDGRQVAMDLPVDALDGLSDQELLLLLTKGVKPS